MKSFYHIFSLKSTAICKFKRFYKENFVALCIITQLSAYALDFLKNKRLLFNHQRQTAAAFIIF